MLRTLLALALASSAWAQLPRTICSLEPAACDGTFNGTQLCAPLHRPPCTMHQRGGVSPACTGWESGAGGGQRAASRRSGGVGWWRRVGARHTAHLPPAADVMMLRAPLSTPCSLAPAPLSQGPLAEGPDRQHALAAWATHQPEGTVSHRISAPPPPSRGRVGGEGGDGGCGGA